MNRRHCIAAGLGVALGVPAEAQTAVGSAIEWPAIRLLDGPVVEPAAWSGYAAVVVFWETYCAFCKRHNAHVDKLHRATRGQPLRILGVAMDTDPQAVRDYMSANGYGFPVTLDPGGLRARLTRRRVIPTTCLVDREGRLRQVIPGEMSEDDVMALGRILIRAPGS
jgi:thiol-disulfide isomerase/thioredoxin